MTKSQKHYDWATIQLYYDQGHSIRQVVNEFGCAALTVQRAIKKGLFQSRDKNALRIEKSTPQTVCLNCAVPTKSKSTYCGNACYAAHKREAYVARWLDGMESGSNSNGDLKQSCRDHLIATANAACSTCGRADHNPFSGRPIVEVDHINGNAEDNAISNLRVLCPSCHAMTENYGSLNRGNGRFYRRLAYAKQNNQITRV